jgi:hypothetical protein
MTNFYAQAAYANGIKHLQAGRWPYIQARIKALEQDFPGVTEEVMARVVAMKSASKNELTTS